MQYVYLRRDTGKIFYRSTTPFLTNPDGSIAVRVTISGVPCTWSEGPIDGSVRRGVRGTGQQLAGSEKPAGYDAGANLPTWAPSDYEQP
jgi:hypothetical protein